MIGWLRGRGLSLAGIRLRALCSAFPGGENLQVSRLLVDGWFHVFYVESLQEQQPSCVCFSVNDCSVLFELLPSQFDLVFSMVVLFDRSVLQVAC